MAYVELKPDTFGFGAFGENIANGALKIVQDLRSFFELSVKTFAEWWDDLWYGLSNLITKIINVSEVFIVCFFVWLGVYTIIYPNDLYQKGMDIAHLGAEFTGGIVNRGAKLLI